MTDIVQRLRSDRIIGTPTILLNEAADEIERLRQLIQDGGMNAIPLAENERLRAALQEIINEEDAHDGRFWASDIARAALEGK